MPRRGIPLAVEIAGCTVRPNVRVGKLSLASRPEDFRTFSGCNQGTHRTLVYQSRGWVLTLTHMPPTRQGSFGAEVEWQVVLSNGLAAFGATGYDLREAREAIDVKLHEYLLALQTLGLS